MPIEAKSMELFWSHDGKCEFQVTHADGTVSRFFMNDAAYSVAVKPGPGAPNSKMALAVGPKSTTDIRTGALIAHVEGLLAKPQN